VIYQNARFRISSTLREHEEYPPRGRLHLVSESWGCRADRSRVARHCLLDQVPGTVAGERYAAPLSARGARFQGARVLLRLSNVTSKIRGSFWFSQRTRTNDNIQVRGRMLLMPYAMAGWISVDAVDGSAVPALSRSFCRR
jgi:hypothetical protein